jgi:mono/diheme cytochrome c family protein
MNRIALALTLSLSLAACGGGGSGGGGGSSEGGESSAGGESAYAGPIASSDVAHGQTRYTAVCGGCHHDGLPPESHGWSAERMRRQIREGDDEMPAIGTTRLPDADREALLAYLVTTGAVAGDAASPASGSTSAP